MHRPHLHRRASAILGVALLAAVGQIALAPAVSADSSPAVSFSDPDVTGSSATLGFTVNRAANAIDSVSCALTDATDAVTVVACGSAAPGAVRRSTAFTTTVADLASGDYEYAVTVTLTDGGTASGSESFTIDDVEVGELAASRAACRALPGSTFTAGVYWWQVWSCEFDAATAEEGAVAASAATPLCLADGGYGLSAGFSGPGRYELSCWVLF
jgi:hypothetical protein